MEDPVIPAIENRIGADASQPGPVQQPEGSFAVVTRRLNGIEMMGYVMPGDTKNHLAAPTPSLASDYKDPVFEPFEGASFRGAS